MVLETIGGDTRVENHCSGLMFLSPCILKDFHILLSVLSDCSEPPLILFRDIRWLH